MTLKYGMTPPGKCSYGKFGGEKFYSVLFTTFKVFTTIIWAALIFY